LGVNIPNFGPTTSPSLLRQWGAFAEDNGFALAMMSDHVAPTPDVTSLYPAPFYDPFIALAWMAEITQHLDIGTTVTILPYRHPLLTARMAANIDHISDGRLVLGVGVGWSPAEYTALGIPFEQRGRITDEYLRAIIAAWGSDRVGLDGEFVSYEDVATGPRPLRVPHPPIWVGGTSRPAIRRAARFGDAWHPNNAEIDWVRRSGIPAMREAAEEVGRNVPAFAPRMRVHPTTVPLGGDRRIGTGTVDQIVDDVVELLDIGATSVVLDTNPDDPTDRRPPRDDWQVLADIRSRCLARGVG
jgi:probable F420-dependent oxidoreductase